MKELVKDSDPYPGTPLTTYEKAQKVLEDTSLERVDPVTLKTLAESNAFSLHYRNPDTDRAAEVANRLAKLFLTYNQRSRQQAAQGAASFLAKQAEDVSRQMQAVDEEVKASRTSMVMPCPSTSSATKPHWIATTTSWQRWNSRSCRAKRRSPCWPCSSARPAPT